MKIKLDNTKTEQILSVSLLALTILFGVWMLVLYQPLTIGQAPVYYNNTTITNTTLNITNSAPFPVTIDLDPVIDLNGYGTKKVYCNVSVYDYDNETVQVNATLYLQGTTAPGNAADYNNLYINSSCKNDTPQDPNMNFTCGFDVLYNADNSSLWVCNATAYNNNERPRGSNESDYAAINPLVAVQVPTLIDYGNLETGQTSPDVEVNITNAGNRDINVSVEGYGSVPGDGLAFVCGFGNIPLSYERYNVTNGIAYTFMTQLSSVRTQIEGEDYWVPQRTNETEESKNATYWKVRVPVGAAGVCNGKIVFTAQDRSGSLN